ncbi:helix-turn-helix domain-containing protein [Clostridium perfringens]|uniref:helix-turn-helix domain-containing protein n=1 Tax=Clostridium perfringens TaxID=1502 RepID=UPI003754ABA1|nr:helix-turn-helix domain-containing protein [Clostridium perfringens]MDK0866017.1 helix-turn-helix domain-containing protein [Clostridium perfringens]
MLDNFLETNIQNKLKLFSILHLDKTVSIKQLCHSLRLSVSGINSIVDELNWNFQGLAEIKKNSSFFSLFVNYDVNFFHLFHSIYRNSNVLHCLKFFITNDQDIPFSEFIENEFLSKSNAYRIRTSCRYYLNNIGLDIKKNQITGEEYRIRFLIALLHYKYGIDCYDIDDASIKTTRDFILSTNQVIDMNYLEQTSNEYGYFECLFVLSWKRKDHPLSTFQSEHLEKLKTVFIYEELKKSLKATVEPVLNTKFSENDYDYIYLVYCCTNSCLFADKWSQEDISKVHDIIFSNGAFSDLIHRFGKKFGKKIENSHSLRATLIYFYKKCLLELQCIIPDNNFYLDSKQNNLTLIIYNQLTDILNSWQKANKISYKIDDNHLFYLSIQVEFILRQYMKPIQIFVLSDLNAELKVMSLYLKRSFSTKRIAITPFLLNAQNKNFFTLQKDSVFIVHRKFERIITSWGIAENNTIVPISVEMNNREIYHIQQAIMNYEKKIFLDFINHN